MLTSYWNDPHDILVAYLDMSNSLKVTLPLEYKGQIYKKIVEYIGKRMWTLIRNWQVYLLPIYNLSLNIKVHSLQNKK